MDHGHGERIVETEGRQERRQPASEHRLAAARWADQKEIVATGRRDLERATPGELAAHVLEIGTGRAGSVERSGRRDIQRPLTRQVPSKLIEVVDEARLDAARNAGLAPIVARHDGALEAE